MRPNDTFRRRLAAMAAAVAAACAAGLPMPSAAQQYPSKPINIVVPYPPGGSADALARLAADRLKETLGQPVIVINKPGAGSLVGTQSVIRAPKDGYTLLFTGSALTIQAAINRKFDVNLERDLAPVGEMVRSNFLIATRTDQPFRTLPEMVQYAKAHPQDLKFGTNGAGTTSFMIFEYLKSLTNISLLHVPYKGSSEVFAALMSGDIQLMADPIFTLQKQVDAGTLRGLALTGGTRSPLLPNVPTIEQAGIPKFNITSWIGLLAPAGTPRPVIDKLGKAVATMMKEPETVRRATSLGFEPSGAGPDEFERTLREELTMWTKLAQERNLQID